MVSVVWHDGEFLRRRSKRNAPYARTVHFLPSREDWKLSLVIYDGVVFCKKTLQSASQMDLRPIRVWWKEGTTLPAREKSGGKLGITKSAETLDWCGWTLVVPTVIVGAVGSKFIVGAFFEK